MLCVRIWRLPRLAIDRKKTWFEHLLVDWQLGLKEFCIFRHVGNETSPLFGVLVVDDLEKDMMAGTTDVKAVAKKCIRLSQQRTNSTIYRWDIQLEAEVAPKASKVGHRLRQNKRSSALSFTILAA